MGPIARMELSDRTQLALRNHDHPRHGDVIVEVPSTFILERGSIVNFDFESGSVDIQFLSVSGHSEVETGAALDLCRLREMIRWEVERPKLAALVPEVSVGDNRIGFLLVRRYLQSR